MKNLRSRRAGGRHPPCSAGPVAHCLFKESGLSLVQVCSDSVTMKDVQLLPQGWQLHAGHGGKEGGSLFISWEENIPPPLSPLSVLETEGWDAHLWLRITPQAAKAEEFPAEGSLPAPALLPQPAVLWQQGRSWSLPEPHPTHSSCAN